MESSIEDLLAAAVRVDTVDEIRALSPETVSLLVTDLDDGKVQALSRFTGLECISSDGAATVTDSGLGVVGGFTKLRALDLEWCRSITDTGLMSLVGLMQLRWLDVSFCPGISADGVARFRALVPECEVEFHDGGSRGVTPESLGRQP